MRPSISALFDGRVKGGFDIYRKNTSDLIMSKQVAASTGKTCCIIMGKNGKQGFRGICELGFGE